MGNKKRVPERWAEFHPFKGVIHDARIIPFKTPLHEQRFIDNPAIADIQWTVDDVLIAIPTVGLVIDLTNKKPGYYDEEVFKSSGVEYAKIPCVGEGVPREDVYHRFCDVVTRFLRRNSRNDMIIGVHCTNGVNRTGYMICRYMVEQLEYTPVEALRMFAVKRGYPIESESYIQAIYDLPPPFGRFEPPLRGYDMPPARYPRPPPDYNLPFVRPTRRDNYDGPAFNDFDGAPRNNFGGHWARYQPESRFQRPGPRYMEPEGDYYGLGRGGGRYPQGPRFDYDNFEYGRPVSYPSRRY